MMNNLNDRFQGITSRQAPVVEAVMPEPKRVFRLERARRFAHTKHWHRVRHYASMVFCVYLAVICAGILQVVGQQQAQNRYQLTAAETKLLTKTSDSLASKLTFDSKNQEYDFNANYQPTKDAANIGGGDYTATLPVDARQGFSLTDPTTKISVTLKPRFASLPGKQQTGKVIYPINQAGATMVYTVKGNGLKEDIIVPKFAGDHLQFSYTLALPAGVEARMLGTSIGIYGADSSLFGNVATGSMKDKTLLDKARQHAPKTTLVMVLPAPTVTGNGAAKAVFKLHGSDLTVDVRDLAKASYPLSIDPSLALASTSDWNSSNFDTNNIDLSVSGQASRAGITGGTIGSWGVGSNSQGNTNFIYNGYGYYIGRCFASYELLGSDGTSFTPTSGAMTTNSPCYTTWDISDFAEYNGYFYAIGGTDKTANNAPCGGTLQPACTYTFTANDNVYYAKVLPDHSLSTWQSTSTLAIHHDSGGVTAYNGYLYAQNQFNNSTGTASNGTTQYVQIKADGTLGTWQTSSSISSPQEIAQSQLVSYNGYAYLIGGTNTSNNGGSTAVYYAPLSSSGFGTWQTTSSLAAATTYHGVIAYRGYLYAIGGCTSLNTGQCINNSNVIGTVQYAPIYSSGGVGAWQTTTGLNATNGRMNPNLVAYNNYIYVTGGSYCSGTSGACTGTGGATTTYNDLQAGVINVPGVATGYTSSTSYSSGRLAYGSAVYNGYVYILGGATGNVSQCDQTPSTLVSDVQYATISTTGTGTWASTTALPATQGATAGRCGFSVQVYQGNLYVIGGYSRTTLTASVFHTDIIYAPINFNGTLGSWTSASNTFTTGRDYEGTALVGPYLYVFGGGNSSGTYQNDTWVSTMSTAGVPGTFSNTGKTFPTGRGLFGFTAVGSYIYLSGGWSGGQNYSTYYTKVNADGSLGGWTSTTANPNTIYEVTLTSANGFMYMTANNFTYYAQINSDGSLGSWTQTSTNSQTYFRVPGVGSVIYQGTLFVLAGCSSEDGNSLCNGYGSTVYYTRLNVGGIGSSGSFTTSSNNLNTGRMSGGSVIVNGYIYAIAGCTSNIDSDGSHCSATTQTVEVSKISNTGDIGAWSTTTSIGTVATNFKTVSYNGTIYVLGGCAAYSITTHTCSSASNVIQYATPSSTTGLISSWTTSSVTLPQLSQGGTATAAHGYIYFAFNTTTYYAQINSATRDLVSINTGSTLAGTYVQNNSAMSSNGNYLYLLGGYDGTNVLSNVQYAPINSDGSIGTWQYTTNMLFPRIGFTVGIANGFVYVLSGYNNLIGFTSTKFEAAPINADGSLGLWQLSPNALNTGRNNALGNSLVYNGYIYIVGGLVTNSASLTTTEYAPLQSSAHVAHLSRLFATDKNTMPANFFTTGSLQTGATNYSVTYQTATSAAPTTWSTASATAMCATDTKYPVSISGDGVSYYWAFLTIDDSQSATFGAETPTMLNDFQLNYHPNPSLRLRGGSTFNGNLIQSLDAP